MDFSAAKDFLQKRLNMPTTMASRVIADEIPAQVRAHCFFSARVAEGNVLERLRAVSDAYGKGEIDLATARMRFKQWYDQAKPGRRFADEEKITNIASTMRLNLVMRQNAAMAAAVGRYQVSRDPEVEERWPCWRYITGPNPRPEHLALDGRVFLKSDPVWHRIYPPWEFNCNCDVEDAELPEKGADTIKAEDVPESLDGFRFDPAEAFREFDPGLIRDEELRWQTTRELERDHGLVLNDDGTMSAPEKKMTLDEAEKFADKFATQVDLAGMSDEQAHSVVKELDALFDKHSPDKMLRLGMYVAKNDGTGAHVVYTMHRSGVSDIKLEFNIDRQRGGIKALADWTPYSEAVKDSIRLRIAEIEADLNTNSGIFSEKDLREAKRSLRHIRPNVGASGNGIDIRDITRHEFGHVAMLQNKEFEKIRRESDRLRQKYIRATDTKIELEARVGAGHSPSRKEREQLGMWDITSLSKYAEANSHEFFAESFCARERGETLPDDVLKLLDMTMKGTTP